MATQTRTQRQAAAKKAAATRRRNAARRTRGRTATRRRATAEITRMEALAKKAERALLIPIGAAVEARERLTETARTATDRRRTRRALNRFERRGAATVRRNRRTLERDVVTRVRSLS
jgi:hypothetical protein